ncbi:MAG: hypothetical protein MUE59_15025 [Thiobacillaceae bacterium]|jgi:hypothetical protein|nr:hypothetical protein [Thiobacillaceae bacterium]
MKSGLVKGMVLALCAADGSTPSNCLPARDSGARPGARVKEVATPQPPVRLAIFCCAAANSTRECKTSLELFDPIPHCAKRSAIAPYDAFSGKISWEFRHTALPNETSVSKPQGAKPFVYRLFRMGSLFR